MQELTIRARVREANKVIGIVSAVGRRMFYSQAYDRVARIGLDKVGQIWWIDQTTGMKLYPFGEGHWFGFVGSALERQLTERLAEFARDGRPLELELFPFTGDPWNYGADAMTEVRTKVLLTGAVAA